MTQAGKVKVRLLLFSHCQEKKELGSGISGKDEKWELYDTTSRHLRTETPSPFPSPQTSARVSTKCVRCQGIDASRMDCTSAKSIGIEYDNA
ncbi:hypothetical protein Pmani_033007 [Petrolisthes manimaculis]|uniref:Uncharacterized protein n=1 Tax=Petrolisthes manimaculis TaxID=1843537 RepID=A0AAE1TT65_9EUCA|nr:hypothetical protein Pmani_033007 [Petrolisthes manimaculis]